VIAALMPGGVIELAHFSVDEIKEATKSFSRLPVDAFVLSPHTTKRLVQLTLWAKDKARLDEVPMFQPNATTQASFVSQINEAQRRDSVRTKRKKTGKVLSSVRIDPPLNSSAGWKDGWLQWKQHSHLHVDPKVSHSHASHVKTKDSSLTAMLLGN
jgi:hypothetical protein